MKYGNGKVSKLLHKFFSDEALESVALSVMIEDTKYLINNNILDDEKKQKEMYNKSVALGYKDNEKTYNKQNINQFRILLDSLISKKEIKSIYDGLTEIEKYAVMALYYD